MRENGGWFSPDAQDGLGLDEGDFDYEEFLRREFGGAEEGRVNWFLRMTPKERLWWFTAVILLMAFLLTFLWPH